MPRLGLCCLFRDEPIRFRTTTAASLKKLSRADARRKLAELCLGNAKMLREALAYCASHDIGCFRINSQILPLQTHPEVGYALSELPGGREIIELFRACGEFARVRNLRTTFHPDQFVVLSSPKPDVVESSLAEIEYQAEVAEWVGADVINIHGGGAYGDKPAALARFRANLGRLSPRARQRLTIENDDKIYTPSDLLPLCRAEGVPLVYDIHHHRCHPDELSAAEATRQALATWNREPLFHISSPRAGWEGPLPQRHHDFIDIRDFPRFWDTLPITVEVEAKAKELAVESLRRALAARTKRSRRSQT
jgi:UV DNA damage endonuclease